MSRTDDLAGSSSSERQAGRAADELAALAREAAHAGAQDEDGAVGELGAVGGPDSAQQLRALERVRRQLEAAQRLARIGSWHAELGRGAPASGSTCPRPRADAASVRTHVRPVGRA